MFTSLRLLGIFFTMRRNNICLSSFPGRRRVSNAKIMTWNSDATSWLEITLYKIPRTPQIYLKNTHLGPRVFCMFWQLSSLSHRINLAYETYVKLQNVYCYSTGSSTYEHNLICDCLLKENSFKQFKLSITWGKTFWNSGVVPSTNLEHSDYFRMKYFTFRVIFTTTVGNIKTNHNWTKFLT